MSGHSNIGPSSAERWIACPGSVALSAQCPRSPSNEYSAQGTVAHDLAEKLATDKLDDLELMAMIGDVVKQEGFDIEITDEMVEGVSLYRDVIQDDMVALLKGAPGKKPELHRYAETTVHIKSISEDLWGTADYIQFVKGHKLVVYDFKFGRGVVEAAENPQMALYCLGAMETIAGEAFDEVELVIVQPRAGHADGAVRRWKAPKEWLSKFRAEAPAAGQETMNPNARIVPGAHGQWCPAKASCPALFKAAQDSAGADFSVVVETPEAKGLPDVKLMTTEALAKAYSWREAVESWFSAVADRIQETLAGGGTVPGYKLVDGRSNRKWIDEEKVVEAWEKLLPEGALFEHKLLSPAKLEKLPGVGKGKIDHLTFKPEAKKAIARDTDPRPKAASKAQDDFEAIDAPKSSAHDLDAELLGGASPVEPGRRDPLWPL